MPIAAYLEPAGRITAEMCLDLPVGHIETLIAERNATAELLWKEYRWPCRIEGGPKNFKKNQTWKMEVLKAGPPETVVSMVLIL